MAEGTFIVCNASPTLTLGQGSATFTQTQHFDKDLIYPAASRGLRQPALSTRVVFKESCCCSAGLLLSQASGVSYYEDFWFCYPSFIKSFNCFRSRTSMSRTQLWQWNCAMDFLKKASLSQQQLQHNMATCCDAVATKWRSCIERQSRRVNITRLWTRVRNCHLLLLYCLGSPRY